MLKFFPIQFKLIKFWNTNIGSEKKIENKNLIHPLIEYKNFNYKFKQVKYDLGAIELDAKG